MLGAGVMAFSQGQLGGAPAPGPATSLPRVASNPETFSRLHSTGTVAGSSRASSRHSSCTELSAASAPPTRPLTSGEQASVNRLSQPRPKTMEGERGSEATLLRSPSWATSRGHIMDPKLKRSASMQSLAMQPKAPSWGFGMGCSREQSQKLLTCFHPEEHTMSKVHSLSSGWYGVHSPGAVYDIEKHGIGGKQSDGAKLDPPVWSQMKAGRWLTDSGITGAPDLKPAPTAYSLHPAIGGVPGYQQFHANGGRANQPRWKQGTSTRDQWALKSYITKEITDALVHGRGAPGVGTYDMKPAVGPATGWSGDVKYNPPKWTLKRRVWPPVGGAETPGPVYDIKQCVGGKQPNGAVEDAPTWKIGSKARPPDEAGRDSPPAKYKVMSAMGTQHAGRRSALSGNVGGKSAPRATFSQFVARDRNFEKQMKESKNRPGPGAHG